MKTLVKTIALITVISLGCVCFSEEDEITREKEKVKEKTAKLLEEAQRNKEEEKTAKLEDSLKALERQKEALKRYQKQLQRQLTELDRQVEAVIPTPGTLPAPAGTKMSGIFLSKGQGGQSADISVVITSEDDQPESISQVTEDMGIMARILDKQVLEIPIPKQRTAGFGDVSLYMYTGVTLNRTRGIYISDYGALFLMDVDFPLLPEPKVEEKEEKKADSGDVWKQTKDELTGRYQEIGPGERGIESYKHKSSFNEAKVKELKEKIIKALKYASNIRSLEPDETIIVTVKGVSNRGGETIREINILGHRFGRGTGGGYGGGFAGGGFDEETESSPTTGMTIIVEKRDVDSFAEGELDYEEFLEDVEIFEY